MAAQFTFNNIIEAIGCVSAGLGTAGSPALDPDSLLTGVSTDTRALRGGEVFFALKGDTHDAHDHLDEAVSKGVSVLVISDASKVPPGFTGAVLVVEDTLHAYQELAAYYRNRLNPFVVAVTGSVGKTTLKDMIACILSGHRSVYWTKGNLNNQVGLPRTILEADADTKVLVLEMGMAGSGEIERLAGIARPDVCAITNIGISHRENFDSDDGILRAKYEIAAFLGSDDALVIETSGSEPLTELAENGSREKGYELLRVAEKGTAASGVADYVFTPGYVDEDDVHVTRFEIVERKTGEAISFAVPIPGAFASVSAALAVAVCSRAGVSISDAAKALVGLKRTPHRLDPIRKNGVLVIDDTYNASPDSVKSGLAYLQSVPAKRRIAVLADMNELGCASGVLHSEVGAAAVLANADIVYAFGEKAQMIAKGARDAADVPGASMRPEICWYDAGGKDMLVKRLREDMREGDAVYVKGSRSMKMEEVVDALMGEA